MKKYKVVTLGCRTNQYESQAYQDQLQAVGYEPAESGADICIVNTCTVTESADSSSRHAIRQLIRENPDAQVIVTGCYAENKPKEIAAIQGVTKVVSNKDKDSLLKMVLPEEELPEFRIAHFEARTRAFVKVQDGCNSFCTYCIIPYVRGRSRSRPVEDVVREVEGLISNGYKEVVLTGINIGDYEGVNGEKLEGLVKVIDNIPGLERLRLSSIDPDEVDDRLTDAILGGKRTCPSLHIVLQSGSNIILKRMNRKYTKQIFMATVDRLRHLQPDFTFTTDVIVGFPGETDRDFQETLDVMRETEFAKVHMFPYSKRERTRAALYTDPVDPHVIKERKNEVLRVSEEIGYKLRSRYVGRRMQILMESGNMGHTANFLPVNVEGERATNELIDVHLADNKPNGLLGV